MNIILFHPNEILKSGRVVVKGRRFKHLITVNKARTDDTFKCGIINGNIGTARVVGIHQDAIELQVDALDLKPPDALPLTLILALPRPKMLRRIIECATSLGVKTIYLINSWRVEKSFWQSPVLQEEKLEKSMILGLEQCGDTLMPSIIKKRLFSPFVHQELAKVCKGTHKIVAHPTGKMVCPSGINSPVCLAIGPEGGFIQQEIAAFEQYGFDPCRIGPRILRVETAVPAIISRMYT